MALEARKRTVTPLPHTIDGFTIQCMGGVCGDPLALPAVSCESRSKVMEMEEHSPSQGKPASSPSSAVNVRFHTSVHGWRMVGMVSAQWWAAVNPTPAAPLDTSLGNPIPSLSRP